MNSAPSPVRHNTPEFVWLAGLLIFWAACVGLSLIVCGGGFLHPESYSFLPHYLSGRPLLPLIFDNQVTDWNNYQARELGFVFDWLDAQFIAASFRHGVVHFFSASHYILLLVAGIALWRIASRHLALPRTVSLALVLLLWTCPTAMLYSSYYRSAKVALLCVTLLTVWSWFAARDGRASFGTMCAILFGVTAAAMPMCDKLGLLFIFGMTAFLAQQAFVRRSPADRRVLIAGIVATVFAWGYQRWIGPAIVRHLMGYDVNVEHLSLSPGRLADVRTLATVVGGSALFTLDSFRIVFGHLSAGLAILAAAWVCHELAKHGPSARPRWLGGGWVFAGMALFITATFAAMLFVFPLMFSNEHRHFYYPLPAGALWITAGAAALAGHLRRRPEHSRWIALIAFALVVGNLFDVQAERFLLRHGKYEPYFENATRVRAALVHPDATNISPAQAAALLPEAPYVRDAVPPSLDQDRIFLLLRTQANAPR
jgi:hypothetical protein